MIQLFMYSVFPTGVSVQKRDAEVTMGNRGETQAARLMRDGWTRFPDISTSVQNTNRHGNTLTTYL